MTNRINLSRDSISLRREANDPGVVRDWTGSAPAPKKAAADLRPLVKPRKSFMDWLRTPLW